MSDHEFEKRVQQQMDDLKLRPSDAVWRGVEINLRRDKRRRRTLLWLPVLGILLATGGYFVFSEPRISNNTPVAENQAPAQPSVADPRKKDLAHQGQHNRQADAGHASAGAPLGGVQPGHATPDNTNTIDVNKQDAHANTSTQTDDTKTITQQPASRTPVVAREGIVAPPSGERAPATQRSKNVPGNKAGVRSAAGAIPDAGGNDRKVQASDKNFSTKQAGNKTGNADNDPNEPAKDKDDTKRQVGNKTGDTEENRNEPAKQVKGDAELVRAQDDNRHIAANNADPNKNAGVRGNDKGAQRDSAASQIPAATPVSQNAANATAADSADLKKAADSAARKAPAVVSTKPRKAKKQTAASKWQWGVIAGAGVTNISEGGVFDLLDRARVEDLANAAPSYAGIPPAPTPQPSPIRTGPVFSAGAFVQRNISSRVHVSLGLQYSYWNAYTKVGQRVDSLATVNFGAYNSQLTNRSYRAENTQHDYTNRYHFVELPLSLGVKLNRSMRTPVTLDAGVSLSRLVYTNALHFDGISRLYYENDDFFNRTQVAFNSSLSVGIFQSRRHPVSIGPSFRYFATKLVKKEAGASRDQHIWSVGIQAKMLLKK